MVFTKTKHGANKVVKNLEVAGIRAEAIHGNKSQVARQNALANFKNHKTRVLVATDIAARGIDIDDLAHVVNYELPNVPETYVHRIGRTGRAGASGIAYSFCNEEEKEYLRDIQKLIGKTLPVILEHPYPMANTSLEKFIPPKFNNAPKSQGAAAKPKQKKKYWGNKPGGKPKLGYPKG